jgi:MFS transporter, NNP family, nitrate/nitrite transporter
MLPKPPKTLEEWDPEDVDRWQNEGGKEVARRNLVISVFSLFLAFAVWVVWSFVVIYLPDVGFGYSDSQLFLLTALPPLVGATGRVLYSFAVPIFGGRRFNAIATASLLIPAVGLGFAVQNPETPFWVMALLAASAGLGGANFSSSMDHVAYLFPERKEGTALGINAGIGNAGVSIAQLVVPIVITVSVFGTLGGSGLPNPDSGTTLWIQNAGFVWVPFILIGAVTSWYGLNDIGNVNANFGEQLTILKRKHNWIMCWLYVGTFGSFLGYATAFPLLTTIQFPEQNVAAVAFWGPLIGALIRPPGGWLSDKLGGARVTFWVFVAMVLGTSGVVYFMIEGLFWGFFASFIVLFFAAGIGNASTFKMIPVIFRQRHVDRVGPSPSPAERKKALNRAELEAGSVLGFSGGVGAYGGFLIPQGFSTSIELTEATVGAMTVFLVFYVSCVLLTWYYYYRSGAEAPC